MSSQVAAGATLERLGTGFSFVEGPVWSPRGRFLLFSDMPADVRRRWDERFGVREVLRPANKCNGMTYDADGALVVCEHSTSRVVRETVDGGREVLAASWQGEELNSPNDVVVGADGSVYFTDPTYGRSAEEGVERDQVLGFQGVFRIRPDRSLELLADDFEQPNGLCFSPDRARLYVNDTPRGQIRAFTVAADGGVDGGEVIRDGIGTGDETEGVPDGMKCDAEGRIYCTGPGGIWVLDPGGRRLELIEVREVVGNMNWGGRDWRTLYIAASTSLYRLQMRTPGAAEPYMATGEPPAVH